MCLRVVVTVKLDMLEGPEAILKFCVVGGHYQDAGLRYKEPEVVELLLKPPEVVPFVFVFGDGVEIVVGTLSAEQHSVYTVCIV